MIRMKNRNQSPVNGWQFYQAQTGWDLIVANPQAQWDFNLAVQTIVAHRQKNPRFNLPTDQTAVANELDFTNAKRMQGITGADSYIQSDEAPVPKTSPQQHPGRLAVAGGVSRIVEGAKTIVEWIRSGNEAVPQELATSRAAVCAKCVKNDKGDWTALFTVPAQNAIRAALAQRRDWNLSTPHDAELHVCSACYCPLPLKVHMPIDDIMKRMPTESLNQLVPECWIRSESTAQ